VPRTELVEITSDILPQVCAFLAAEIDRGIAAAEFAAAFEPRWAGGPSGFALLADGAVVGALATIRSRRTIRGQLRDVCNLSSWAVAPSFRAFAPALLRKAIAQPGVVFTNFTASAAVAGILRAFRFDEMSTEERVLLPFSRQSNRVATWTADVETIVQALCARGREDAATCVNDHRGTRTRWLLVDFGEESCAIALHLMRAKQVPFAYVLYCSAPHLLGDSLAALRRGSRQMWGWRLVAWPRACFQNAAGTVGVRRPQPVLFKGEDVSAADLDGLYSELTLLPILR
jgi:hypothetical protein